jgi:hypothetical protein
MINQIQYTFYLHQQKLQMAPALVAPGPIAQLGIRRAVGWFKSKVIELSKCTFDERSSIL